MKSLAQSLKKLLAHFPQKKKATSLLLQVPPENSLEAQIVLTKNLTDRGFKVVVLSGGRPCRDLLSIYEEKKINLQKIHIVDMICRSQKIDVKDTKNVTHMDGLDSLTQISVNLGKMIVPEKTVVFVDSITSMLLYSKEELFTQFVSHIVQQMKTRCIHLILLIIKTKNYDTLRAELKYICDQEATF